METAVVEVRIWKENIDEDIEVPLDITVNELLLALKSIYDLDINLENVASRHLKTEYPIALLKGSKALREFGVRNGTVFHITE